MKPLRSVLAAAVFSAFAASAVQASTLNFACFTNNSPGDCSQLTNNLSVDISNPIGNDVQFVFNNNSPIPATVANVYWNSSLLDYGSPVISSLPGVSFSVGGSPGNLPSGQNLTPPFVTDFTVSADSPAASNGIDPGEQLTVTLDLLGGVSYATFLASFRADGSSRIGMHVISVGPNGQFSESMVNTPGSGPGFPPTPDISVIPVPGALPLMLSGLLGLSLLARRRLTH